MSDGWGYDSGFAGTVTPVLDLVADRWWRVRPVGGEHVPPGAALVVASGDGVRAHDALVLASALRRLTNRVPRLLLPGAAFEVPFLAPAIRRLGGVPAQDADALGLLADGQLVATFCASRTDTRFAELALEAGVPVVPCAITTLPWLPFRVPASALRLLPSPSRVGVALEAPLQPGADPGDRAAVFDLADAVRERIAAGVHRNLVDRGGGGST